MKSKLSDSALVNTTIPWHTLEVEEALKMQESNFDTGLTFEQASERLQQYGTNELQEFGSRKPLSILIEQFTNIMLVMLIAVAVVSAILDLRSGDFPFICNRDILYCNSQWFTWLFTRKPRRKSPCCSQTS
ncbi:hypothetical protein RIVM261_049730 [Rivularia sp. IAM M-261]|nr:hypothetical protein RIVM261_049730 [Rivularia sp. IAM M-261]